MAAISRRIQQTFLKRFLELDEGSIGLSDLRRCDEASECHIEFVFG
jgi:hypothetical protein